MPGAGEMVLKLRLTANDLTGSALKSAEANTRRYTSTSKREFKDLLDTATSYRKLVGSIIAAKVLSRGMAYLEQGISAVTSNIVEMDQALTSAAAKFGPDVMRGNENFREMQKIVEGLGQATEYTASEVASGLDFLAQAGFDYQQSMKALPALTDLATASQTDFARASDIASDALGAFRLSTAPGEIEKNLNRVNDVFAATVTSSNTTMETLFDTMKMAGPVVEGGIEMFGTLAGTLGSAGIKGTVAATALKNMFIRLQAPPREAEKALRKLRVEIDDGSGNMDSMINIIGKLNDAFRGMGEIERKAYLSDIFGQRAITGAVVLLDKGKEALQEYYNELSNSKGAAKEMADEIRGGLGNQIKLLESALIGKGFEIFKGLMGERDPAKAVKELVEVVRQFDVGPVVDGLREIGGYIKSTVEILWEYRDLIRSIARVWLVTNAAGRLLGFTGALGQFTGMMRGLDPVTLKLTTNMGELTRSVGLFQSAMMAAQPVLTVLIASIATGYEISKKLEEMERKKESRESKFARWSMGKTMKGESLPVREAERALQELQAEWKKTEYDRRSLGEEGLTLLGGKKSRIREDEMLQVTAEGLSRYIESYWNRVAKGATLRNEMLGGFRGRPRDEVSSEYWQGEGWMSEVAKLEEQGKNVSGQSVAMPQITWDPKQEFMVNVTVNGVAEGTTASATIEKIPQVSEKKLGVPNG